MTNKAITCVDLTQDVGYDQAPLELRDCVHTRQKIIAANDAFFDMWEDCLYVMVVKGGNERLIVHCLTHLDDNRNRNMAQYGWVKAYFQDCEPQE